MLTGKKILHYLNATVFIMFMLLTILLIWFCIGDIFDMQDPEKIARYPFGGEGPVTWNYVSARVYLGAAKQSLILLSQTLIASLLLYFSNRKHWANLVLILPWVMGFFFMEQVG